MPGAGATASAGHCFHARPGSRPAGTGLQFLVERGDEDEAGAWYFAVVFPPRVRQALPVGAPQFGQSWPSTANAP